MSIGLEELTTALLDTGLLDDDTLESALGQVGAGSGDISPEALLDHLTAEGQLTQFQSQRLGEGRGHELVFGNYLVLNHLGEGGMGDVFKALHRRMQRIVALKVIKADVAGEQEIRRFQREIQAAARLNHPNIVVAYDADRCERGDFLVMEYVEGADLKDIVEESGPLDVDDALEYIRQAAVALGLAHKSGIVHRDIKPANLMRDISGLVKVADLGLAQMRDNVEAWDASLTAAGSVMGTIDYMSPEQAADTGSVDHRADIYSLGCTLYFLLKGEPVFTGRLMKRMLKHRELPPPKLHEAVEGVSPEVDALFQRMVAKKPEERQDSMETVVAEIEALQGAGKEADGDTSQGDGPAATAWRPQESAAMLVVDSKLQTAMLTKKMNEAGLAEVHTCASGAEAIERLRTVPIQLLVVSRTLPDMTGLQLAERVREDLRWSQTAVMVITSDPAQDAATQTLSRMSRAGVLPKSFDAKMLSDMLEKMFREDDDDGSLTGLESLQVLIADDSKLAQKRVEKTLRDIGFREFTIVDDGTGVMEHMQVSEFDLVVTDYNMPVMNGRDVIRFIRQGSKQPELPVIMVTTEYDPQKLGEIYQLGVSAICGKAFEREQVRNIVLQLFM